MKIHTKAGALWETSGCRFTLWGPELKSPAVILTSQKSTHLLSKCERGYWTTFIPNVLPGTRYLFQLDGKDVFPDPASFNQPDGVFGPSAVADPSFEWTDETWIGRRLDDMIIYELHVGTFTPAGSFEGVTSRLPYLKQLGINTIELMPVNQFSGDRNWGYDGVFPFAVQNSYGGHQELKKFVEAAHQAGIAVLLDVVYNHFGPEGNNFSRFGPYFTDTYKSNWGSAVNFDGEWSDGVRDFFIQNALMWLDEFHIDGLRLDAVHAIFDNGAVHFLKALQHEVTEYNLMSGKNKLLIAESDRNDPSIINSVGTGGYGLAGQWCDEFHHALHAVVTGEVNGYYEDFGAYSDVTAAIRNSYVYTGQYSIHRKKYFGAYPFENSYSQFVVFSQNHDQIGNRILGERLAMLTSFEMLKVCAALVLLSAQVPLLFMGEEYGEKNPFQYFASHQDPTLVEAVREGRKKEFHYFQSDKPTPDPFALKTFTDCQLSWEATSPERSYLFALHQKLIEIRKSRIALRGKTRNGVAILTTDVEGLIAVSRVHDHDNVVLVYNFTKEPQECKFLDVATRRKIFSTADREWGGVGSQTDDKHSIVLSVAPHSCTLFEHVL